MTVSVEELPSLVTEGALFMDAIDPEWFWIVEPETLEMCDGERCVLGQYAGRFYDPEAFGLDTDSDVYEPEELAFSSYCLEISRYLEAEVEWNRLWRDEINDRRAEWFENHGARR